MITDENSSGLSPHRKEPLINTRDMLHSKLSLARAVRAKESQDRNIAQRNIKGRTLKHRALHEACAVEYSCISQRMHDQALSTLKFETSNS